MTHDNIWPNRFWGTRTPPTSKAEFFNAVTAPAQSGSGTVATIRMYGPIDSYGGYWGISTKDVGQVLDALPDTVTQIILRINSPGGHVFEGVSILNMLRAHKAKVTAVVDGLAASAASVIASGCDDVVMSPGTQMMIHSPSTIVWGDAAAMRKEADVLDSIEASLIEIYTAKAGEKDWTALLAEETWLTAAGAVELGLADRVAVVPDAGEAETVGFDPDDDTDDDGFYEDSASTMRGALTATRAAARTPKLPSSSEPGEPNQKEKLNMSDTIKAGLRERLGVTDADASDETLLAALDETLNEQADPIPTATIATLPAGTVAIDATVLAELQDNARQGAEARAEQDQTRREGIINDALRTGRITPASAANWREQLEANEDGTTKLLASLAKNTVPLTEIGGADAVSSADDALYNTIYPTKEA